MGKAQTPFKGSGTHEFRARIVAFTDAEHPLGTDELGRDLWSRLIYGARIVLVILPLSEDLWVPGDPEDQPIVSPVTPETPLTTDALTCDATTRSEERRGGKECRSRW